MMEFTRVMNYEACNRCRGVNDVKLEMHGAQGVSREPECTSLRAQSTWCDSKRMKQGGSL